MQGNIRRVRLEEIRRELLFAEGRLICSEYLISNDPDYIVKFLSELNEFDLSIELALLYNEKGNISVAYPLMVMMKYYCKITEGEEENKESMIDV